MANKIINSYNALVPTMNKLVDDGRDIWEFHDSWSGYGFKVIEKDFYIEVSISAYIDEDNQYFITKHKRNGNIFSPMDETLEQIVTTIPSNVYELIKSLL